MDKIKGQPIIKIFTHWNCSFRSLLSCLVLGLPAPPWCSGWPLCYARGSWRSSWPNPGWGASLRLSSRPDSWLWFPRGLRWSCPSAWALEVSILLLVQNGLCVLPEVAEGLLGLPEVVGPLYVSPRVQAPDCSAPKVNEGLLGLAEGVEHFCVSPHVQAHDSGNSEVDKGLVQVPKLCRSSRGSPFLCLSSRTDTCCSASEVQEDLSHVYELCQSLFSRRLNFLGSWPARGCGA